jgi:alpha,alpha-trehalase
MRNFTFESVIFDLDGVITKTAQVHAEAWKSVFDEYLHLRERRDGEPFREFTHDEDYLPYVDGKPRYNGVQSFLESRGIHIPFGDPSDAPEQETACGIGNRKNVVFREILKIRGAEIYTSTVEFIHALKHAGIRVGIASSSRNCSLILESAKLELLFETRVDGEISAQQGLKGKPEGDIFVTAARNLNTTPEKSVVVEDATSGVQAGRNGEFGLVLGVARKGNVSELLANGADVVVSDLSEMTIDWMEKWFRKKPRSLFASWDTLREVADTFSDAQTKRRIPALNPYYMRTASAVFENRKRFVFFLDYDGTLTPIVERPELAIMHEDMKNVVQRLSERHTVAIVSGRMREDVQKLVNIEGLFYAGSHGFDIVGPGFSMVQPQAEEVIPVIAQITAHLSQELERIPGTLIEMKKFSVAVHYRLVAEEHLPRIKEVVDAVIQKQRRLRVMSGKKVYEILPDIEWDKGKAVRWIMKVLDIPWTEASVVYIGDDVTDEYAFRVLRTRGTGILVSDASVPSAADFQLTSTDEVKRLFEKIIAFS